MASALRSVGARALLHMHSVPGMDERETDASSTFNGEGTEEGYRVQTQVTGLAKKSLD